MHRETRHCSRSLRRASPQGAAREATLGRFGLAEILSSPLVPATPGSVLLLAGPTFAE